MLILCRKGKIIIKAKDKQKIAANSFSFVKNANFTYADP